MDEPSDTQSASYADRLRHHSGRRWKRWLGVQIPYRWNLRRLHPEFTLDIGCGIGRNLDHLDGYGVGVDHNVEAVAEARRRGLVAFDPEGFLASKYATPRRFDSLLLAHVLEHMKRSEAEELLASYLPYLRDGGAVILIAPQEAGYRSDPTHVQYADDEWLASLLVRNGLAVHRSYSFPLPRFAGRWFRHNEFVVVGRRP